MYNCAAHTASITLLPILMVLAFIFQVSTDCSGDKKCYRPRLFCSNFPIFSEVLIGIEIKSCKSNEAFMNGI